MPELSTARRPVQSVPTPSAAAKTRNKNDLLRLKAKEIYTVLTKRDIRREGPSDAQKVEDSIFDALKEHRRVNFTVLWGGFKEGPTGTADSFDIAALDRLVKIKKDIIAILGTIPTEHDPKWHSESYWVNVDILFCDMHHRLASGISDEKCETYRSTLTPEANKRKIRVNILSERYEKAYENAKENAPWYMRALHWSIFQPSTYEFYSLFNNESIAKRCDELCADAKFMSELLPMAKKHSALYRRWMSLKSVARAYIEVELGFLELVQSRYDLSGIFISYSKPSIQGRLFGETPAVYFYATKRGVSDCPWFMYEGKKQAGPTGRTKETDEDSGINYKGYMRAKNAVKYACAAVISAMTFLYLPGQYGIPYTLLAGKEIAGMVAESSAAWRAFRDKYYMNDKETPTWDEFDAISTGSERQIRDACFNLHIRVPDYVETADANEKRMLELNDVKSDEAARLIAEGNRLLDESIKDNEQVSLPAMKHKTVRAMTQFLDANKIEPKSITVMVRISRAARMLEQLESSKFWLIQANARYLEKLKKAN